MSRTPAATTIANPDPRSPMIALLADVHGNLTALEAVIADMAAFPVETVISLGDVAAMGPEPSATVKRLRELVHHAVLGNTDAYLLSPRTRDQVTNADARTPAFLELEAWGTAQLDADDLSWLATFTPTVTFDQGSCRVLGYHGSPRRYDDPILPDTPDEQLARYFDGFEANLYVGAHVHHAFTRRYRRAGVVNPGSVGMAYHRLGDGVEQPAVAEYVLLHVVNGQPNLFFRRVPYDAEVLQDAVQRSGMPHPTLFLHNQVSS